MRIVDFRPFPDEPGFREALLELADEVLPGDLERARPTAPAPVAVGFADDLTDAQLSAEATQVKHDLERALGEAFSVEFSVSGAAPAAPQGAQPR